MYPTSDPVAGNARYTDKDRRPAMAEVDVQTVAGI